MECQEQYSIDADLNSVAQYVTDWWRHMPIVKVALDPFDAAAWPTVWEIIARGHCCEYSRGLAMAYNLYYLDIDLPVEVVRAYDHRAGEEYFAAIVDGLVLNHRCGQPVRIQDIDPKTIDIQERWTISALLNQKE